MKCPVCNDVRMREVVKDNVLIDVCPDCKGVWLDRGELDKLMQGVKEMKQEVERLEQYSAGAGAFGGSTATPAQPTSGPAPGSWAANNNNNQPVNNSQPQGQGTPSFPQVSSGSPFVQPSQPGQPVPPQQQGGFGQQAHGNPGNPQVTPMNNYGGSQPQVFGGGHQPPFGQQGYNNNSHNHGGYDKHGYDKYGYDKHGYNKYGHSHKRKKTVLDVFGDLFD